MDDLRNNLYDRFKDRRYAAIWFGVFAAMMLVLLLIAAMFQTPKGIDLHPLWPEILAGIILLLLAVAWRIFRLSREARLNRYKSSPLSRDEIIKARSKLKTK